MSGTGTIDYAASAENVSVDFAGEGGKTIKAVSGVSFSVRLRETFGLIGESGSGKSTLGRVMVCLLKPSSGRIVHGSIDPNTLTSAQLRRHCRDFQMIFQDPNAALDPRMTILQSVREPLDIVGERSTKERTQAACDALERVGIAADLAKRYPHELSGGQKQRVNIARALTLDPKVIVCDEVVSALDVSIRADILNLFMALQKDLGLTYIFVTHDIGVVSHFSDRIAVMYLGKIVELADTSSLIEAPLHPYTEALLSSEPLPLPSALRTRKRIVLTGEIPSPTAPPSGCHFRTRCPAAADICAVEVPAWRELKPQHWVACHFAGSVTGSEPLRA